MRISPSQVQGFDLCQRRWAFKIIEGIPEPQSAAQADGVLGHKRVENLLTRGDHPGDDALGKLVQAAMRPGILPVPGPHLLVEHEFTIPLNAAGDAFYGFIDCVAPPENGRVLVTDNKFTSSLDWAKTPADLATDAQHVGYSRAALEIFSGHPIREVEGRWIYLQKNSTKVRPVSLVRTVAQVHEAWRPVEQKAHAMLELRKRKIPAEQLEGNKDACSMYGKAGCPYRDRCSVGRNLGKFDFGARNKLFTIKENDGIAPSSQGEQLMAIPLFDQLQQMKQRLTGGAPALAPAQTAPAPAPAPAQAAPAPAPQPAQLSGSGASNNAAQLGAPAPAQAAPGVNATLAALQRAKGATGVNPPAQPAQQPLPGTAPAPSGIMAKLGMKASATKAAPAPVAVAVTTTPADATVMHLTAEQAAAIDAVAASTPTQTLDAIKTAGEKKPRKNGKAAAPASQPKGEAKSQLTVLYNVAITKRPGENADPVQLVDLLAPLMRQVADENSKAHWSLIEFGQGKALLAHAFDKWLEESQWKGTVYVNGRSEEAYAVKAVLDAHADVVCTGLA